MSTVGHIGLGNIGMAIAVKQIERGFDLVAFDVRAEPLDRLRRLGARSASSPREVAEYADTVCLSVRDDAQVLSVALGPDGLLRAARPGTSIIIHTTCHPTTVLQIGQQARAANVGVIDAPVTKGSVGGVVATLCFMVGGDDAIVEKCNAVLTASGDKIVHVGPLGAGVKAKLAHQVICIGTLNAVAEGMLLAEAAGVDLRAFADVLPHSSARSHFTDTWVSGRFRDRPPEASAVMRDSVDPALSLARELDIRLPLTALAQQLYPFWSGKRNG